MFYTEHLRTTASEYFIANSLTSVAHNLLSKTTDPLFSGMCLFFTIVSSHYADFSFYQVWMSSFF